MGFVLIPFLLNFDLPRKKAKLDKFLIIQLFISLSTGMLLNDQEDSKFIGYCEQLSFINSNLN